MQTRRNRKPVIKVVHSALFRERRKILHAAAEGDIVGVEKEENMEMIAHTHPKVADDVGSGNGGVWVVLDEILFAVDDDGGFVLERGWWINSKKTPKLKEDQQT